MIRTNRRPARRGGGFSGGRILIGLLVAAFALISYFGSKEYNPVTEKNQYISLTPRQEIAMGLQAAPEMARQFGGLAPDEQAQAHLDQVCQRILDNSTAGQTEWPFECHLLADSETVNAFALPGGQVFITQALSARLETEGQLAGVMGHEIGHVIGRHSAERIAQSEMLQGLTGAAVIATYDPERPSSQQTAQMAALVAQLVNLRFGRDDELEADRLGVRFLAEAGYDPRALIRVMEILAEAGGPDRPPEFFNTHPNPENRIGEIQAAIEAEFPNGVPEGLTE